MRSAPALKIWMTPFASVAMHEKLALLKIAFRNADAVRTASFFRTSRVSFARPAAGRLSALGAGNGTGMGRAGAVPDWADMRHAFSAESATPGRGCNPTA